MLSPAEHLAADEIEDPGGMTWREVKDFLDHMRETCIKDRQELKLEVRRLRQENARLMRLIDGSIRSEPLANASEAGDERPPGFDGSGCA